ncbi:arylsulfatase A-like enzyme [Salinibacter ruber]|uniref:sulfatase n=1 Tax=Salinibacter ruber TaxID=146919 RepID=UPI0021691A2D|nr:arylsulfatase A-like enzyme [Salinibacter ruber]
MRNRPLFVLSLLGFLLFGCAAEECSAQRPNVLIIVADDLGYADIGAYNDDSLYETPHVDSLARRGVMFADGYAANPVCSPSRYSLLTGRVPSRENHTDWFCGNRTGRFRHAQYDCSMDTSRVTLGDAFQDAGYATRFGGKWHLGPDSIHWPKNQGFDINKGSWRGGSPVAHGSGGYFSPYDNPRPADGLNGEYLPFRLADEVEQFIDTHRDDPFFALLSFYEVHNPRQSPDPLVQKYLWKRERLDLDAKSEFEPIEVGQPWEEGRAQKARVVQGHPVYAAMVDALDHSGGQVLEALSERRLSENTVVVFVSDNGGLSTAEGHNTSNRPLRCGKGWVYEGGIRVPHVIYWPGVTYTGSTTDVPAIMTDLYPTLFDAAGLPKCPDEHVDGTSLAPVLKGRSSLDRDALFWHYPHYSNQGGFPGGAVRSGPWKLVEDYRDGSVQLFNLERDPGGQQDVSVEHPERLDRLRTRLHDWYDRVDARFLRAKEDGPRPWRPGGDPEHKATVCSSPSIFPPVGTTRRCPYDE